jgi:DNA polymerase
MTKAASGGGDFSPRELAGQLREHLEGVSGVPQKWFDSCPPVLGESPNTINGPCAWDELRTAALGCVKCRLAETRTKVVFGAGKTQSPLIAFVGEGPGADEDRQGEPFVGKAGQLLTAAITKGLGLRREDVYIANVVKCRPPNNRTPLEDEVQSCIPYLFQQLELLQPRVIVTLGQPAQLALSGVKMGITKLRGNWQEWRGIKLMPTFHPAYILRNPAVKRQFWEDLQEVMREVGLKS